MEALKIIENIRKIDCNLTLINDKIRVLFPEQDNFVFPVEIEKTIKENKPEIIDFLKAQEQRKIKEHIKAVNEALEIFEGSILPDEHIEEIAIKFIDLLKNKYKTLIEQKEGVKYLWKHSLFKGLNRFNKQLALYSIKKAVNYLKGGK